MARPPAHGAWRTGPGPLQDRIASTTLHILGIALAAVSVGMAACAVLEAVTSRRDTAPLAWSAVVAGTLGGLLWYFTRPGPIRKRQIFGTVAWTWILTTVVGALPFVLAGTFIAPGAGFVEQVVNSVFESASGFSASGSTVLGRLRHPGPGAHDVPPAHPLVRGHGRGGDGGGGAPVPRRRRPGADHRRDAGHFLGPSRPQGERDGQAAVDGLHRLHGLRGGRLLGGGRLLVGLRRGGPRLHARLHRGLLPERRLDRSLRQRGGGGGGDRVHGPRGHQLLASLAGGHGPHPAVPPQQRVPDVPDDAGAGPPP